MPLSFTSHDSSVAYAIAVLQTHAFSAVMCIKRRAPCEETSLVAELVSSVCPNRHRKRARCSRRLSSCFPLSWQGQAARETSMWMRLKIDHLGSGPTTISGPRLRTASRTAARTSTARMAARKAGTSTAPCAARTASPSLTAACASSSTSPTRTASELASRRTSRAPSRPVRRAWSSTRRPCPVLMLPGQRTDP